MLMVRKPGIKWVSGGDKSSADIIYTALTRDNAWHDLDISALVPAGTKLVLFRIAYSSSTVANFVKLRKHGFVNTGNISSTIGPVAGQQIHADVMVECSTDRHIDYMLSVNTTLCNITVSGWFR